MLPLPPKGMWCPFCWKFYAGTMREEVEHMNSEHMDIVEERLRKAGLTEQEIKEVK